MILINEQVLQHSNNLKSYIFEQIDAMGGKIAFSEYMQHCLYAPGSGYYNAGLKKFGANGDFITAPELGPLFAKTLSIQLREIMQSITNPEILEIGAGSGKLACDLLKDLDAKGSLPCAYKILELSPDLRFRQQEYLMQECPQYLPIVRWLDELPNEPIDGVIIANEVLDAMPCSRFKYDNGILREYYVAVDDNKFYSVLDNPGSKLTNTFNKLKISSYLPSTYTSELNLWLEGWITSIAKSLNIGAILLCDYGFDRKQYYHPQRIEGTLMCHYQHQAHSDPFINIGLQDITAHVDFTHVAEAASNEDLYIAGYTTLASFLINCGITGLIVENSISQAQELNTLTSPAEMGELFKMIILTTMQQEDFIGFRQYDKTHLL